MKKRERFFRNGLLNENRIHLIKKIADMVKENTIKKIPHLSFDQLIQVYEETVELKKINEEVRV